MYTQIHASYILVRICKKDETKKQTCCANNNLIHRISNELNIRYCLASHFFDVNGVNGVVQI